MKRLSAFIGILVLLTSCGSTSKSIIVSENQIEQKQDSTGFDILKSWGYDFKMYDPIPCGCSYGGKSKSTPRKSKYLMENPYKSMTKNPIVITDPDMIEWIKKRSVKVEKKKDIVPIL